MISLFGFVCLSAFSASFMASRLMVKVGVSDIPVGRSNHKAPVPTAGGLGVLCGVAAGCLALSLPWAGGGVFSDLPAILSLSFAIALTGFYDDLYSPPTEIKFGIFLVVSGLLIYALGVITALPIGGHVLSLPLWIGATGSVLWVFVVINSVNFMDGANGFMPGCIMIAFTALAAMSLKEQAIQTCWLASICAAGWAGFLPWNARKKAIIFAGDIGALLAGFMFAAAALLFIRETNNHNLVYMGPLLLLPFLADVLLTLLWRLKRRQNLLRPHRDHLYQRAIRCGLTHRRISLIYYAAFAICGAAAYGVLGQDSKVVFWGFAAMTALSIMVYSLGHMTWRVEDIN